MRRHGDRPIISPGDIPDLGPHLRDVSAVFNPGATTFNNQVVLILRVQNRGRETFLMPAYSTNGIDFEVASRTIHLRGIEMVKDPIYHVYDPRMTRIGQTYYMIVAMDMPTGCRLGLARTHDFEDFEFMGLVSLEDNRNGVLFSEQIDGHFLRLDRPNQVKTSSGVTTGNSICLSMSKDLIHWETQGPIFHGNFHYWDELIGAGPPPLKTRHGWLLIYHGVATHFASANIYQAGVALLDLKDPSKLIARGRYNILEPRMPYEMMGQVPNVVFPSGLVAKELDQEGFAPDQSELFIYYGAADTHVALATTTVAELIQACQEDSL